jgi:hypothetical protein
MDSLPEIKLQTERIGPTIQQRPVPLSDWLSFLETYYNKTIRTQVEADSLVDKPIVIFPDVKSVNRFYALNKTTKNIYFIDYNPKQSTIQQLIKTEDVMNEYSFNPITFQTLKQALGIQAGGGKRRSRKAKKGPSPQ